MSSYRVYVGTFGKYAAGSIKGKWLDLEDYKDKDKFMEACKELHKDEADPEFMFNDHEGKIKHMGTVSHYRQSVDSINVSGIDRTVGYTGQRHQPAHPATSTGRPRCERQGACQGQGQGS
jgi:hypothetical protein